MNKLSYDAIIVLGAGLNPDGSLTDDDRTRLKKVIELRNEKAVGSIIVCGSQGYKAIKNNELSEAQAYANFLYEFGVPQNEVYLESESKETLGNILFAKMQIIMKHDWYKLLILPTTKHSTERIKYLLGKIFGDGYEWDILRVGENNEPANLEREAKALRNTKEINDEYTDGDHLAIYNGLMKTHPAYGGTKWTIDELREEMKHTD